MTDVECAKNNLAGHTLCLCKDGNLLYSEKRGIAPMMDFIAAGADLTGYAAADAVVGKATALLFVRCGIASVYARTLSVSAQKVLAQHAITCEYETLTERIINRDGTDTCPMEKTVLHTQDPEQAYILLKEKLAALRT